jgi:hypothetical protein
VFSKIFEALYLKVFVNIIINRESTDLFIEVRSKKKSIESIEHTFKGIFLSDEMVSFIKQYTKETPYYYISVLDSSLIQGALPTCKKSEFAFYTDLSNCEYKCYENRWTYYTSKSELYALEKSYKEIGIDFVFSPFVILSQFFQDKIEGKIALYALVQDAYVSIAVFENSQLLYAEHLDIISQTTTDEILINDDFEDDELDLDDEGIDLETIDIDDNGSPLDDFGDIEDLDSLDEIEDFDGAKDVEEEFLENEIEEHEDGDHSDSFNEDYQRFSAIQASISHFYKDERYESQFLENIYIADGVGVSRDLKKYLEEEMFLNVYVRHAELGVEICEMAKKELGLS